MTIRTRPATPEYKEGFDRIFGKKKDDESEVAQSVEQRPVKPLVEGSNPSLGANVGSPPADNLIATGSPKG